jgi:sugar O-acyltransferase (sialic acid O-acetyltransferase NeuD family)
MTSMHPITEIVLLGGGGQGLAVHAAALACDMFNVLGFYDDDPQASLATRAGLRRIAPLTPILRGAVPTGTAAPVLCLGDLLLRRKLMDALRENPVGTAWLTSSPVVIHPRAIVDPSAHIGPGTFVGPGGIVHCFAQVGPHAIINTHAIIEHECEIAENVHVAPGAALAGRIRVGRDALIGLGSRVLPGLTIGAHARVGAGAVVVRDVPDHATVVGVPAATLDRVRT